MALAELDSPASSQEADRQTTFSDQAVEASAREADLYPLALAREQAPEAASLPYQVYRDFPRRAPEAFLAFLLPLSGESRKALAPIVLVATTVVSTVDIRITAMAMMVLVWAATD